MRYSVFIAARRTGSTSVVLRSPLRLRGSCAAGNHKNSGLSSVAGTLEKELGSGTLIRAAPHTKYAMRLQTNDARQLDVTYLGPDGAIRGFNNETPASRCRWALGALWRAGERAVAAQACDESRLWD